MGNKIERGRRFQSATYATMHVVLKKHFLNIFLMCIGYHRFSMVNHLVLKILPLTVYNNKGKDYSY